MEWLKTQSLSGVFSKGNYQDRGVFNVLHSFSPYTINTRTLSGSTVLRNGFTSVAVDKTKIQSKIQGMTALNNTLYAVFDKKLKKVNLVTGEYEDIPTAEFSDDYNVEFINFDKYVIALTGIWLPYVLNTTTNTWTQLTNTNIEDGANPKIGAIYGYGSYVIGWPNGNILYMSRGATKNNIEYVYDWKWTGSEQIMLKGWKGLWIVSTLNRLFIWTETGIEYISKETMTSVGNVTTTLTVPLWWENRPVSQRSIVVADEVIFFVTSAWNSIQIKSIWYVQGITDPQVGNISETTTVSLRWFFEQLDTNQSECYGYYNKAQRTVTWYFKKKGSIINDVCLVYDIIWDNFFIDTGKFWRCGSFCNNTYYVGSGLNNVTYNVDVGYDDDGNAIGWERYTKKFDFWHPNKRKVLREVWISGELPDWGEIFVDIIVDGKIKYTTKIEQNESWEMMWFGNDALWSQKIGWEKGSPQKYYLFNKLITRGQIRLKGLRYQFRFYGNKPWKNFVLSNMNVAVKALDNTDLWDQI